MEGWNSQLAKGWGVYAQPSFLSHEVRASPNAWRGDSGHLTSRV